MNEIFKLKEMLEQADIPFEFYLEKEGYHICYPMDGEKLFALPTPSNTCGAGKRRMAKKI